VTDHVAKALYRLVLLLRVEHLWVQLDVRIRLVLALLQNISLSSLRLVVISRMFDRVASLCLNVSLLQRRSSWVSLLKLVVK
jgi:hypothetical protein